jgi:hypothetical protein
MTRYATIAPILAAGVLLAACGSSSKPTSASAVASKQADGLALANCVRSHGVPNFPDPSGNGHGGIQIQQRDRSGSGPSTEVNGVPINAPAFKSAMQACSKYEPNGGAPSAAQTAKLKAKALAMSRCMRSHGVPNFPDPQFQSGGGGFGIRLTGGGVNPQSPAFQAAQKACGSIFGGVPVAKPGAGG